HMVHFDIVLHATYETAYKDIVDPAVSVVIMNTPTSHPDIIASDKLLTNHGQYTLGLYDHEAGIPEILMVASRIKPNEYGIVALHEIGHSIGILEHCKADDAIMHAGIDGTINHLTRNDLIEFCNLYWCDEKKLHTCE